MAYRRSLGRDRREGEQDGPPADPVSVAREIALRALTTRARTRLELQQTLASRGVPTEVADQVLNRLGDVGLIDDTSFASAWAESRQRGGRSSRVIRQELRTKGVADSTIIETMAGLPDDADYQAALALARKRVGAMASLDGQTRYRRLGGALARRGFSSSVVARVLREVLAEASEVSDIEH